MKRQQPGNLITDLNQIEPVKLKTNEFLVQIQSTMYNQRISIVDFDIYDKNELLDIPHYLVFNRWVRRGRKKIDLREYYMTNITSVFDYLKKNFVLGDEFELIVFPQQNNPEYAFYVNDSIYWIDAQGLF